MSTARSHHSPASPLFASDLELYDLLGCGEHTGRAAIRALEREGFPQRDPLFGGKRYLPAVRRFLDLRYGFGSELDAASERLPVEGGGR